MSLASLLLSQSQRGRDSRPGRRTAAKTSPTRELEIKPDYEPLTREELDASVCKERFVASAWLPKPGGEGSVGDSFKDLHLKDADIEAVAAKVVEKVTKATGGVLRG